MVAWLATRSQCIALDGFYTVSMTSCMIQLPVGRILRAAHKCMQRSNGRLHLRLGAMAAWSACLHCQMPSQLQTAPASLLSSPIGPRGTVRLSLFCLALSRPGSACWRLAGQLRTCRKPRFLLLLDASMAPGLYQDFNEGCSERIYYTAASQSTFTHSTH